MSETIQSRWKELTSQLKSIFLRWEKLRALYNLALFFTTWGLLVDPQLQLRDPKNLVWCLCGALVANLCFFLGPVLESYFFLLDVRGRWVSAIIFLVGTLFSLPLVVFVLQSAAMEWEWA